MASPQRVSAGFFGPVMEGLERPVRLPGTALRQRGVRLPRSVHSELAGIAAASRRAASGDLEAGVSQVQRMLLHRATMGPTSRDYERIGAIGYDAYLEEQLDYESLDDSELEASLASELPTLDMGPGQLFQSYVNNPIVPIIELWTAAVYRAVYSPRQLFERMVVLWTDHFNIDIFAQTQSLLKPVDDRQVVRAHALGSFHDLLSASAHSPAMLVYLTNDSNVKGHPNENYARELMELHTMGAGNGYTEDDVKEVARCFTGWRVNGPFRDREEPGTFLFRAEDHDDGKKTVLGETIAAGGGISDGERIIEMLAGKRDTAEYIATKLLRFFWGYEPEKPAIRRARRAFQKSNGDLRETLREVLSQKRLSSATPKLKRPFHLVTHSLRALGAEIADARFALQGLRDAGHLPFEWTAPDGYPDDETFWSGFVLPRWNWGATLLQEGNRSGVAVDPSVDDPSGSPSSIVDRIDTMLTDGGLSDVTRDEIRAYLRAGAVNRTRVREAIGLALASPEFQEY